MDGVLRGQAGRQCPASNLTARIQKGGWRQAGSERDKKAAEQQFAIHSFHIEETLGLQECNWES